MTKDEKEFRTWLKNNYGIQDYNNYSGTQAEELAIQYAHFKQNGTNTLVMESVCPNCKSNEIIEFLNRNKRQCQICEHRWQTDP